MYCVMTSCSPGYAERMETMKGKSGWGVGIGLSILSFIIGLAGIMMLFGVGEGTNNAIKAFAAVSLPFALFAAFFSWLAPNARWAIAIVMVVPVTILGILGAWSGSVIILGTLWTILLTLLAANLGGWLRTRKAGGTTPPPTDPPAS